MASAFPGNYILWVSDKDRVISFHRVDGYREMFFTDRKLFSEFLQSHIDMYYKIQ